MVSETCGNVVRTLDRYDKCSHFVEREACRKADIRLPGKGNSNSRGARPAYSFR